MNDPRSQEAVMDDSLLATFTRRDEAVDAVRRLRAEHPEMDVELGDEDDVLEAMVINQRAELGDAAVVGPASFLSGPMMRGGLVGAGVGFVLGAILIMPILLLIDWPDEQRVLFFVMVAIIGGFAGAVASILIGMVRRSQTEGEFTPEDPWAVVRVRSRERGAPHDERLDDVTKELMESGARSVRPMTHPLARHTIDGVETPRVPTARPPADDWPAGQRGARSDSV